MHACTGMYKYVFVKKGTIYSVSYAVCCILELAMSKDETGNKKEIVYNTAYAHTQ